MDGASNSHPKPTACEVIDFDDALLDACPPAEKADLLTEARILAQVFATEGGPSELQDMAQTLSTGVREAHMERAHARKLSAALKRLAKGDSEAA